MKKISIIGAVLAAIAFSFSATSCQDMLLKDSDRFGYESANDTLYSYWGIMRCVQDIAERQVILGEVRGDLVKGTPYMSDTIGAIANFENPRNGSSSLLSISDYYAVVNNCNAYIANADTNQIKGNQKFMLPEYKQVQIIRSWIYLQLVQNYGEVPFILEPITSLEVIDRFDGTMVNTDNLVEKLITLVDLPRFSDTQYAAYPSIGSYDNGAVSIASTQCYFSADVVMGDIYLTAGEYDKAAQSYYDFLKQTSGTSLNNVQGCTASLNNSGTVSYSASGFLSRMKDYNGNKSLGVTLIPGASNRRFGKMLTSHVNVMGWVTESSISSDVIQDSDGNEEVNDGGSISIMPDITMMQITPSDGFYTLSANQTYQELNRSGVLRIIEGGDARKNGSGTNSGLPIMSYSPSGSSDSYNFINKFTASMGISYTIPVYHKTQIFLRFAEAINRAGHPEYAFAVLKDGLCADNLPTLGTSMVTDSIFEAEEFIRVDTSYVDVVIPPVVDNGGAYYIGLEALLNAQGVPYLDFANSMWDSNVKGIHNAGCGDAYGRNDTIYTLEKLYAPYLSEEVTELPKEQVIELVEDAIVDEMALELAFEGYRFTDLIRVAGHKTNAGLDGAAWLADKVARRNDDGSSDYQHSSEYQSLFQKLMNKTNWYLHKPESYR